MNPNFSHNITLSSSASHISLPWLLSLNCREWWSSYNYGYWLKLWLLHVACCGRGVQKDYKKPFVPTAKSPCPLYILGTRAHRLSILFTDGLSFPLGFATSETQYIFWQALQSHGVSSTLRDGVLRAGQYSTLYIAPDSGPSQVRTVLSAVFSQ